MKSIEKINLAYKYRLRPDAEQRKTLGSLFALQRRAWNCLLGVSHELMEQNKTAEIKTPVSECIKAGRRTYTELRKQPENSWMNEVLSNHRYLDYVAQNLHAAWGRFFDAVKKGDVKKKQDHYLERVKLTGKKFNKKRFDNICKPKFKSRFDHQSYTCDFKGGLKEVDFSAGILYLNTAIKTTIGIPFVINTKDKIYKEDIKKIAKITISKDNTHAYYVSISFECEREIDDTFDIEKSVGIDMGCITYAVLSDGTSYDMPDTNRIDVKIKKIQEQLSKSYEANKDTEGWQKKNWQKLKLKISKLHKRKSSKRSQATHTFTNAVTKKYDVICIEDLNVKGMTKEAAPKLGDDGKTFVRNNKKQKAGLNRSILDKNFHETGRQLKYKAEWNGKKLVKVDRFYASSKICNGCGHKNTELILAQREWICAECGSVNDRDLNASKNIRDEGIKKVA